MTADGAVHVVLGAPAGLARVPVRRPDGGWLYPVAGVPAGASQAGVAVDVTGAPADGARSEPTDHAPPGTRLVDSEAVSLAGLDAKRTLTLVFESPVAVVVEQWRLEVGRRRITLTATADLAAWAALAPILRAAIAGVRIEVPR